MREDSGQMMLINAFMLVIVIVTITLMLNNIIYSSNMAYAGFMDQSRYDDISLKEATAKEASHAYSIYITHPSNYDYDKHIDDYERALNNLMSLKGRYVEITSTEYPTPSQTLGISVETMTTMTTYGNDAKLSYVLYTGDDGKTPPTPTPIAYGDVAKVELYQSKVSMVSSPDANVLKDYVILRAVVKDASGNLIPNKAVQFQLDDREDDKGQTIPADYAFLNLDLSTPPPPPPTDSSGQVRIAYVDKKIDAGTAYISATCDGIKSSTVQIAVSPPLCDSHNIDFYDPIIIPVDNNPNKNKGRYFVILPVKFVGFLNGKVMTDIDAGVSDNIIIKTSPVFYTNYKSSYNDVIVTEIQLDDENDLSTYWLELTFEVQATCTQCTPNRPYDKIWTVTITREKQLMPPPTPTNPP
ncbi:hypothetical protein MCP_0262 [Methanocella paludicola SANAE]|uniref:Big-1 domain-containing protein n=1 Tax=Methanocella paludicola (strain DSM 17711 / JCM 13418 / NBRC 101707 / SANAE) TaxID=304371 RepID=D1YV62_METPS|nr:Ig-like domain-containing protein [Methanocella paludicola]BAI60334.1 hypothetical protein MCP_0262 [Methanocella paludicola SANAE]